MSGKSKTLLKRLELIKDTDPFNKTILNDCFEVIQEMYAEIDRLALHNQRLLQVTYQNQSDLESLGHEPTGE
jgi:hypothetical protein